MTTTTIDPLAGLPTTATKTKGTTIKGTVTATAPTPIGPARKALAKRKATSTERKDAVSFAKSAVGYDDTSPIWGKKMVEVLLTIEANLDGYLKSISPVGNPQVEEALLWNRELQKRVAQNSLIAHQLKR